MYPERDLAPMWYEIERDRTHLACADFGGAGSPVMLLHGLAGHATEWDQTSSWLTPSHHVVAPDLRGHGRSERVPHDVSRDAHVADVAAWITYLGSGPVSLVGQSLGGHTAFLVAARHADLVDKLVIVEASPGPADDRLPAGAENKTVEGVRRWLESWPVPFASRDAAMKFFGRNDNWARAWADGLEERDSGFFPSFDVDVMVKTLEAADGSYWDEWRSIKCPILLVVAKERDNPTLAHQMIHEQPNASLVEIPDAGHDLHLDNPSSWHKALELFLDGPAGAMPGEISVRNAVSAIRRSAAPRGMVTRVVAIDGPGGAGKSSLSHRLGSELGAQIVHTDDFASWGNPIDWWPELIEKVLEPLAKGETAHYTPTRWGGPPRDEVVIEPGEFLILEGVTASREAFRPYLAYSIWIETPRELRLKRGVERDGEGMREQWHKWMAGEDQYVEREHPADRADLVLPGDRDLWL